MTTIPPPGRAASVPEAVTTTDDRTLAVWHWPGAPGRPQLHWAHANGYHGRTYMPLLDQLAAFADVRAWDMRGHGASAAAGVPGTLRNWQTYYRDLVGLIDSLDAPIWLSGHSVGATTSIMAAARRPRKVRGLVLVEPVLLEPLQGLGMLGLKLVRRAHRFPLSALAARRRPAFASRDEAFQNYRGRGGFRTWPDDWLAAYVEHAFVDDSNGGVRLAAAPAWESDSFAAVECNPWRGIARLECPVIALAGERESTFSRRSQRLFARLAPRAEIQTVPGTTHFVPMERPGTVYDVIRRMVGTAAP